MNLFRKPVDSVSLSLPMPKMVRGYEIRRMPVGVYLQAMKGLNAFPAKIIEAVFPGKSLEDILIALKSCNTELIGQMVLRALTVVPGEATAFLSALTGIPERELLEDADIGLDGLLEIIDAWVEVNGLENFTQAVTALFQKVKGMVAGSTGSKG